MNKFPKILVALTISILLLSCGNENVVRYDLPDYSGVAPLKIVYDSIKIVGDPGEFKVDKSVVKQEEGVYLVTFDFSSETPSELIPVTVQFNFPSIDIMGYWNPGMGVDKVNFWSNRFTSKASRNAPVMAYYNNGLQNRITMALSDALNKSDISCYLKEEDVNFYPRFTLFSERMPLTTFYSITLRIDTRPIPYFEAINDVATWWADMPEYKPMFVPDDAKKPMYSTWYSYHQNISMEEIVKECKIASALGCDAVIVDDGWQTVDGNRGYAYTGDWYPERIPNMKEFVEAVHNENMKFILWYSLPFIGENARNFQKFKGKYLNYWDSQGTYVLDPRYPEVREFIVNTYVNAIKEWNLDGFKLDFIGRFTANENTKLTKENGRDYASVNEATDALMTEVTKTLTKIKPDILIEFRQPYIGPLMRKYGNMFRGVDCPNNAVANRLEVTNLRILSQNTAVHSDMFIWRVEEPVEKAALQILNILYSVPQLSVRLEEVPEPHLDMIRYWFDYWNKNREVLLEGSFYPSNPGANYPVLTAAANGHQITTIYDDIVVTVMENISSIDVINARDNTTVAVNFQSPFKGKIKIIDCEGNLIHEENVNLHAGISSISIPRSGMAQFEK